MTRTVPLLYAGWLMLALVAFTLAPSLAQSWWCESLDDPSDARQIQRCIDEGANVNAVNSYGETPLHQAAIGDGREDLAVAQALIRGGARVNARARDGDTPLHVAAAFVAEGHRAADDIALALIRAGADVDARNNQGRTPIHHLALELELDWNREAESVARALIRNRANLNVRDSHGNTPLGYAQQLNPRLAEILREAGARE